MRSKEKQFSPDATAVQPASAMIRAALLIVASLAAFFHVWLDIITVASRDEEASHAFLVPVVVLWLFWCRRDKLDEVSGRHQIWGVAFFAIAMCLHEAGLHYRVQVLWHLSAIVGLYAGICFSFGLDFFRRFPAALFACLFAIPIPGLVRQQISLPLQFRSAQITEYILTWFNIDVQQFGNVLQVNGTLVTVAEACNGMRMLFAVLLIIFAFCFSLPVHRGWKIVLLVASPLMAMFMNIVRLVVTVALYGTLSAEYAKWFHDVNGWLIPLGLMAILVYLADDDSTTLSATESRGERYQRKAHPLLTAVAAGLFGLAALSHTVMMPSHDAVVSHRAEIERSFAQVPYAANGWIATECSLHEAEVSLLKPTAGLRRRYKNLETQREVSVVAIASGRARDMIGHEPSICLKGQGWVLRDRRAMPIAYGETVVNADYLMFDFSSPDTHIAKRVTSVLVIPGGDSSGNGRLVAEVANDFRLEPFGAMSLQISSDFHYTDEQWSEVSRDLVRLFLPAMNQYRQCKEPRANVATDLLAERTQ